VGVNPSRNFDRRVEIAFPILDSQLQTRLKDILAVQLGDNVKGWWIQPDGSSIRAQTDGSDDHRSQERLYDLIQ
jgi:polyphosphate kinase